VARRRYIGFPIFAKVINILSLDFFTFSQGYPQLLTFGIQFAFSPKNDIVEKVYMKKEK
jgi:hypothetical protein